MNTDKIVDSKVTTMTDLSGKKSKVLLFKNETEIEAFKEQLRIGGVDSSLTAKEAIDYEIYARRKDKEENLKGWLFSMFFTLIFFFGIFVIIRSCNI